MEATCSSNVHFRRLRCLFLLFRILFSQNSRTLSCVSFFSDFWHTVGADVFSTLVLLISYLNLVRKTAVESKSKKLTQQPER